MVYEPIPSVLLSKSYSEYAHLYMELYSATSQIGQSYMLNLSLEHAGEYVMDEYFDNTFQKSTDSFSLKIPLADLAAGKYMVQSPHKPMSNRMYGTLSLCSQRISNSAIASLRIRTMSKP
jgi:hypothetical protein